MNILKKLKEVALAQRGEGLRSLKYANGEIIFNELDRDREGKEPRTEDELYSLKKKNKELEKEMLPLLMKSLGVFVFLFTMIFAFIFSAKAGFVILVIGLFFLSPVIGLLAFMLGSFLIFL